MPPPAPRPQRRPWHCTVPTLHHSTAVALHRSAPCSSRQPKNLVNLSSLDSRKDSYACRHGGCCKGTSNTPRISASEASAKASTGWPRSAAATAARSKVCTRPVTAATGNAAAAGSGSRRRALLLRTRSSTHLLLNSDCHRCSKASSPPEPSVQGHRRGRCP